MVGGIGVALVFLPLSRISRLKFPAIMRWLECCVLRVRIWCWISMIKCMSSWCVGMYMFRITIGVRGLLLIRMACMYGDIVLGVGSLVMFSFGCTHTSLVWTPRMEGLIILV